MHTHLDKAAGMNDLPARFVKDGARRRANSLTHLVNLTIHIGVVPSDLKLARIVPVFKGGNRTDPGKYRSVSVLGIIFRGVECAIHIRAEQYTESKALLYPYPLLLYRLTFVKFNCPS